MSTKIKKEVSLELLEKILNLFNTHGLHSTSMNDICIYLKISKRTLYQYFSNKDNVVEQVISFRQKKFHDLDNNLVKKIIKENPILTLLMTKNIIVQNFNRKTPNNIFDIKKYHPSVYNKLQEKNNIFYSKFLTETIERGIDDGIFEKKTDTELQIYLFTNQMSFLDDPEIFTNIKFPMDKVLSIIFENFIRSISTTKGLKEYKELVSIPLPNFRDIMIKFANKNKEEHGIKNIR